MKNISTDVAVIGGGPGGSTTAAILAMQGHRVALFEREKFPREHVGESLLPFCYGLFAELGVLEEMTRKFVRKPGVRFIDPKGEASTAWCFSHVIQDESYLSFQVARAEFDHILLENCRRKGVEVHEQSAVRACRMDEAGGPVQIVAEQSGGERIACSARFLIDASGRDTFIGSRNGWRRPNEHLDRTALWTHFTGASLIEGLEQGLSVIIYMGGEKKGWIWVFPLDRGRVTIGAVMENRYLRDQKSKFAAEGRADWLQALFMQEIQASPFVRRVLGPTSRAAMPVLVNADYSYTVEKKYGKNFALVGDAGRFLDPIFSSGVFLAMKTARLVAGALDGWLGREDADAEVLLAPVYQMVNGAYEFVHRMIQLFYNPHQLNWATMASAVDTDFARFYNAHAAGHYMLAGDFFESQAKYNELFRMLEDPENFKAYTKVVVDRPAFQASSCEVADAVVFPLDVLRPTE